MNWQIKSYDALTKDELFEILKLRVDVFVVEQACPYPEIDDIDRAPETRHLFLVKGEQILAYARCYRKSVTTASIGRVIVSSILRGQGVAHDLMHRAIACCDTDITHEALVISAQCYLDKFYTGLGFVKQGEDYLEDGIPHQDMLFVKK
ncbi:GNAT family N-acetyltransferase [Pseudoalteromonas sp. GCY]|uniref:GNAT family N-acetyltransferase n=1 Tax=Pseudoalteromonas sp. GCY TaxID=2003316 RepID=UPI000BFEF003|nr:GNAT family N-acetyltransferase [Pseudoalteromonas sp. GCY]PHI38804.1 GNAT family N-acetyltransferase [Pseudoalteromonas sp. GCY]QQQ65900.1 GNAT family N-acetyltransferase [Pseudoalteromonas sp. GCY]